MSVIRAAGFPMRRFHIWAGLCVAALCASFPGIALAQTSTPAAGAVKVLVTSPVAVFDSSTTERLAQVRQRARFPGFLIDDKGHVVSFVGMRWWPELVHPGVTIAVETSDGERHPAEVLGVDERVSLAVLSVRNNAERFLPLGEFPEGGQVRLLHLGPQGWQSGTPFLLRTEKRRFVPEREVQFGGLGRSQRGWDNSLILDKEGRLVGIVTATRDYRFSRTIGIYRVLPSEVIRESTAQIVKSRSNVSAGWMGVNLQADGPSLPVIEGVFHGGPAHQAGLRPGDKVVKVGEEPVAHWQEFVNAIRWAGAGRSLQLTVTRNGNPEEVVVRLSRRLDTLPRMERKVRPPESWTAAGAETEARIAPVLPPLPFQMGFELAPLSRQLAEYFKCPDGQGLLVHEVLTDSPAARAGFKAGDVLIRVNDSTVSSLVDIHRLFSLPEGPEFEIQFVRGGRVLSRRLVLR